MPDTRLLLDGAELEPLLSQAKGLGGKVVKVERVHRGMGPFASLRYEVTVDAPGLEVPASEVPSNLTVGGAGAGGAVAGGAAAGGGAGGATAGGGATGGSLGGDARASRPAGIAALLAAAEGEDASESTDRAGVPGAGATGAGAFGAGSRDAGSAGAGALGAGSVGAGASGAAANSEHDAQVIALPVRGAEASSGTGVAAGVAAGGADRTATGAMNAGVMGAGAMGTGTAGAQNVAAPSSTGEASDSPPMSRDELQEMIAAARHSFANAGQGPARPLGSASSSPSATVAGSATGSAATPQPAATPAQTGRRVAPTRFVDAPSVLRSPWDTPVESIARENRDAVHNTVAPAGSAQQAADVDPAEPRAWAPTRLTGDDVQVRRASSSGPESAQADEPAGAARPSDASPRAEGSQPSAHPSGAYPSRVAARRARAEASGEPATAFSFAGEQAPTAPAPTDGHTPALPTAPSSPTSPEVTVPEFDALAANRPSLASSADRAPANLAAARSARSGGGSEHLRSLGVPRRLLPAEGGDEVEVLVHLLRELPSAPPVQAAAGDVVVLVGDVALYPRALEQLAAASRLDVQVVRVGEVPGVASEELEDPEHVADLLAEVRGSAVPSVLAVVVGPTEKRRERRRASEVLEELSATTVPQTWAVLDARRRLEQLEDMLDAQPVRRPDLALVFHSGQTRRPGDLLRLDVPIAGFDGLRASRAVWAGLLEDAARA